MHIYFHYYYCSWHSRSCFRDVSQTSILTNKTKNRENYMCACVCVCGGGGGVAHVCW